MNLQELIKEHNLKAGDDVVCVGQDSVTCYDIGSTYKISSNMNGEFMLDNSHTGRSGVFELPNKKPTPHKHCELIKAWADGAVIQRKIGISDWGWGVVDPNWLLTSEYRIKPDNTEEIDPYKLYCKLIYDGRMQDSYTEVSRKNAIEIARHFKLKSDELE